MKLIGRHPFVVALVSALAVLTYFLIQEGTEPRGPGAFGPQAVPVVVADSAPVTFTDTIEALGTTKANESVAITATVTEKVAEINFSEGDWVEKGQILVKLTQEEEQAQLAEARATFDEARKQLTRVRDLVAQGNAPQSRLDTQESLVEQAKAQIEAIEARIANRLIRAPFSGRLGLRQVSAGTLVTPGTTITTLDDIRVLDLDFTVPEAYLDRIERGQSITARSTAYPDRVFTGKVDSVDTRINPVTRAAMVRARLPNADERLRPGMLMVVEAVHDEVRALAIPAEAVINLGNHQFVYTVTDEGTAERLEVRVGRRNANYAQIMEGLEAGATVIVEGHSVVQPGQKVEIVERRLIKTDGSAPAARADETARG